MLIVTFQGKYPKWEKGFPFLSNSLRILRCNLNFESIYCSYWFPYHHLFLQIFTWKQNSIYFGKYFIKIWFIAKCKERNNPSTRHLDVFDIWCRDIRFIMTNSCFFLLKFWWRTIEWVSVNTNYCMAFSHLIVCEFAYY